MEGSLVHFLVAVMNLQIVLILIREMLKCTLIILLLMLMELSHNLYGLSQVVVFIFYAIFIFLLIDHRTVCAY